MDVSQDQSLHTITDHKSMNNDINTYLIMTTFRFCTLWLRDKLGLKSAGRPAVHLPSKSNKSDTLRKDFTAERTSRSGRIPLLI